MLPEKTNLYYFRGLSMKIKFWGTRGSISTPYKNQLKYGGNTLCIEINDSKTSIVLDAGYGLVNLGKNIIENAKMYRQRNIPIFLTHMHWDHIQGLPFFIPIFDPRYTIQLYGNSNYSRSLREIIEQQFSLNYSPIGTLEMLNAELKLIELMAGETHKIANFIVEPFDVPHTTPTFGFKVTNKNTSIFYTGDCEFGIDGFGKKLIERIQGSELIIHDAHFITKDYKNYPGWGHSSMDQAIQNAILSNVKHIVFFHYSPEYSDRVLDTEIKRLRKKYRGKIKITAATEGLTLKV